MNGITFFIEDSQICNFANDNTLFAPDLKLNGVFLRLKNDIQKTLVWFESNMMVANPSKFQVIFMRLGNDCKHCIEIDKMVIITIDKVKLRGVIIDFN